MLDMATVTTGSALMNPVFAKTPGHVDVLSLPPGKTMVLVGATGFGLTRIGLAALVGPARLGPVAYMDVRGWLCPSVAWTAGIAPERFIVVRCSDPVQWSRAVATLIDGVRAVYAEVPRGVKDPQLRTLVSLAQRRDSTLVLRSTVDVPVGLGYVRLAAESVKWEGTDAGHGRLGRRRVVLRASGKAMRGIPRLIEVEDHGTDDLHLVSGLAITPPGRAAG